MAAKLLSVPLPTDTSPAPKPMTLSVKLTATATLAALLYEAAEMEMDGVGAIESCVIVGTVRAAETLPAASVEVTTK